MKNRRTSSPPALAKIDGLTPRRVVSIGEVVAELAQIVAFRAEMVVNHVHHDGQSPRVSRIDEPLQLLRTSIGVLHGKGMHAVVAPVASARETAPRASVRSR